MNVHCLLFLRFRTSAEGVVGLVVKFREEDYCMGCSFSVLKHGLAA